MKFVGLFFAFLVSFPAFAQAPRMFAAQVVDGTWSRTLYPRAINSNGEVVGEASLVDGRLVGFLFSKGQLTRIGDFGAQYSWATGINDHGELVGQAINADRSYDVFTVRPGGIPEFVMRGVKRRPLAINNARQILFSDGLVLNASTGTSITIPGFSDSHFDFQFNNQGGVAATLSPFIEFAADIYSRRTVLFFNGTLHRRVPWTPVEWTGINDAGDYVGRRRNDGMIVANLSGQDKELSTGEPFSSGGGIPKINNRGQVIWQGIDTNIYIHLNEHLLNVSASEELSARFPGFSYANMFNDSGQIVFYSFNNNQLLILTPREDLARYTPLSVPVGGRLMSGAIALVLLTFGFARLRTRRDLTN